MRRAGVAEGVIMKIGGWRTRSAFERYAIVSRSDITDAILKLQDRKLHDYVKLLPDADPGGWERIGAL